MKTLLILRHAKSSWKAATSADHDRPLNKRGKRDAPRMGELLLELNLVPDKIICSTAVRARDTAARVAERSGFRGTTQWTDSLYLAEPGDILRVLTEVEDTVARAMIVGHNPSLEELLTVLTGRDLAFPTAALAQVDIDINHWSQIDSPPPATLIDLWLPRELE